MSDFKVGDRFSVEGVVTELADPDGEYCARFDGAHSGGYVARSIMAHATLIEPGRESRYDWSNIPPEYEWAATDKSGTVYAYKNKPVCHPDVNHEYWYDKEGEAKYLRAGPITKNWRDSLEQRPGATHITPCKGTNCGSTNGVHSPECQAEHIAAITGVPMENKVLDLSKPVYVKEHPHLKVVGIWGPGSRDLYMIEYEGAHVTLKYGHELENIPEPKITTSDVLSLWEFKTGARAFLWGDGEVCATRLSQVRVSYTDGEGWSIEEMK